MNTKQQTRCGVVTDSGHADATHRWAVEINGEIGNLYTSRSDARIIRNEVAKQGMKASVRKVELKVVKGAR